MSLLTSLAHHVLLRYANRYGLAYPILASRQPRFTMISSRQPERASAYINQHLRDPDDPSGLILDISSTTDLLDRLRFSSLILEGEKIRRCSTQELKTSVSAFLDLRPDGYAVHQKSKRLAILEFTRAMDSSDDWELQKDAEKRKRYAPVLEFFNSLPDRQGWSLLQFNFTVGVRGSISTEDRADPLSFVSTLKALGISSRVNLEKIRKIRSTRLDASQLLCSEIQLFLLCGFFTITG